MNCRSSSNVGAKASLWSKFADGHKEKQALNPFSDTFDKVRKTSLFKLFKLKLQQPISGETEKLVVQQG